MTTAFRWFPAVAALALAAGPSAAQTGVPFTPGNVVVYRIGSGSAALTSSATQVYLDEYNFAGTRVQSILLDGLTAIGSGNVGSIPQGRLNLSPDGRFLAVTGYGAAPGAALIGTSAAAVPRVVQVVNGLGQVQSTTSLTDAYSASSGTTAAAPTGAITTNGTDIYLIGQGSSQSAGTTGGLRYATAGSTTSVRLADAGNAANNGLPTVGVYGGQLFASRVPTGTATVAQVGTGLPTGGSPAVTQITNISTVGQFVLAELNPAVDGPDTAYTLTGGTLAKFTKDGNGSWTQTGGLVNVPTATAAGDALTIRLDLQGRPNLAGGYDLLLSEFGPTASAIFTLSDANGYNQAISTSAFTQIAVADPNTSFRGVEFAPIAPVPEPTALLGLAAAVLGAARLARRFLGSGAGTVDAI